MTRGCGWVCATLIVAFLSAARRAPGLRAEPRGQSAVATERPLPDIGVLMHAVEAHQRQDEAKLKDYIYRQTQTLDEIDGHGGLRKREIRVFNVFWLQGVPVRKMISKDGKPLSPDELKKEDDRIDKEVRSARAKREKNDGKGKQTDPRGNEEVTVSRILELGTFSHARRVQLNGRDTIAADYAGDPKATTRNRAEDLIRDLVGTVWVDEEDKELTKTEGRFVRSFKIGAGLVASIREGTNFGMEQRKINDEIWLPTVLEGQGAARLLLFFNFNGKARITDEDFRKFKATSTMLPGVGKVEEQP